MENLPERFLPAVTKPVASRRLRLLNKSVLSPEVHGIDDEGEGKKRMSRLARGQGRDTLVEISRGGECTLLPPLTCESR